MVRGAVVVAVVVVVVAVVVVVVPMVLVASKAGRRDWGRLIGSTSWR